MERLDRVMSMKQASEEEILNIAVRISKEDARHARRRIALLAKLRELDYDENNIFGDHTPKFAFSGITTVVEAAPDEEAMLQVVMVRLQKRGNYDPLIAELAIATLGPHDIDALVSFLDSLSITKPPNNSKSANGKVFVECVACEDQLPPRDLILASCGHCYCGSCLDMVFNAAVLDESLYPPSCCANTPIPVEHVKKFLEPELVTTFHDKGVEFGTIDRTYCSDPACSAFIPPSEIHSDVVACGSCNKDTCVACKAPDHSGDCPADEHLTALLKHAEEMRWQRCYNCLRIVQRIDGCDHIECQCGHGFCYNCGRPSRDGATCVCLREYEEQRPNLTIDLVTGEEIMHNYRLYQRPADGSRPAAPVEERDEYGWPDDMDQVERDRLRAEHARQQEILLQGWDLGGPGFDEDPDGIERGPALEQEILPDGFDWEELELEANQTTIEEENIERARNFMAQWGDDEENESLYEDDAPPPLPRLFIARNIMPPHRIIGPFLEDRVRDQELEGIYEFMEYHDTDEESAEPQPNTSATLPSAPPIENEDPWNLNDDPSVCLHREWWNRRGTVTCSVCETNSRRTFYCEDCEMQVCRRCRDGGRVPYGIIQLPWIGGEITAEVADHEVHW